MMHIDKGATRVVLLIGPYAIKFPSFRFGWTFFLKGLLSNMRENHLGKVPLRGLCPVIFSIPGGWVTVMRRAEPLPAGMWTYGTLTTGIALEYEIDDQEANFGMLDGKVVLIDYGVET